VNTSQHQPKDALPQAGNDSGRDARGQFAKGNFGGPGNPFARKVAALRTALIASVTEEDMRSIAEQLVVSARLGDLAAIKLLFQYVLGKPAAAVDPDTLDLQEVELYRRGPSPQEVHEVTCERLPADTVAEVLRVAMPCKGARFLDTTARQVLGIGPDEEIVGDADESDADDRPTTVGAQGGIKRQEAVTAPSANGEVTDDPRQMVTPPSARGGAAACETPPWDECRSDRECQAAAGRGYQVRLPHGP
jgi:hypothetical protein